MNVLLINPPAQHIIRESLPPVVEDFTGIYPPLGLLYVASYVEDVPGCQVKILDCQAERIHHEDIEKKIIEYEADVIGIQVMTFTLIDAILVAKKIRRIKPNTLIVFGGPHGTIYPRETVALPEVDVVIIGEGEFVFSSLLRHIQLNKAIENIPGVMTKQTSQIDNTFTRIRYIRDLDKLKMPAYHLLDISLYYSPMVKTKKVITMMSSRGCPFRCNFCDRPQMGKKFRKKSAKKIFNEISYCANELGIKEIIFYDDTFTVDKERVLELCDLIIESKIKILWDIRARIDTMSKGTITKLSQAGCNRIHYGIETGSPRLQKIIKKNLDIDNVHEIMKITCKEKIETLGYFMIGLPSETEEDLNLTLKLIKSLPMDYAHISIFTPYPGTEIYQQALDSDIYSFDYWREFALNPVADFSPKYWNEKFTDEELFIILKKAYSMFYKRPSYIFNRLIKVRSPSELMRKASLGFKLLKDMKA